MIMKTITLKENEKLQLNFKNSNFIIELIDNNLNVTIKNNINLTIDGNINIVSNNLNIDTPNGKIHLNSRMSEQIKDLPESINYRKEIEKRQLLILQNQEEINNLLNTIKKQFDINYEKI